MYMFFCQHDVLYYVNTIALSVCVCVHVAILVPFGFFVLTFPVSVSGSVLRVAALDFTKLGCIEWIAG